MLLLCSFSIQIALDPPSLAAVPILVGEEWMHQPSVPSSGREVCSLPTGWQGGRTSPAAALALSSPWARTVRTWQTLPRPTVASWQAQPHGGSRAPWRTTDTPAQLSWSSDQACAPPLPPPTPSSGAPRRAAPPAPPPLGIAPPWTDLPPSTRLTARLFKSTREEQKGDITTTRAVYRWFY